MTRTLPFVVALVLGYLIAPTPAQTRTNFSGQWTSTPDAVAAAAQRGAGAEGARRGGGGGRARSGDMGSGLGSTIAVTQDARQLMIEYVFFSRGDLQPPLRFRYALDGTPTTNVVTMGRGDQEQVSRTRWDGDTLVITTAHTFLEPGTGEKVETTVTDKLSLESPDSMIVEVTRAGVLGGPASTTRTVYRKQS